MSEVRDNLFLTVTSRKCSYTQSGYIALNIINFSFRKMFVQGYTDSQKKLFLLKAFSKNSLRDFFCQVPQVMCPGNFKIPVRVENQQNQMLKKNRNTNVIKEYFVLEAEMMRIFTSSFMSVSNCKREANVYCSRHKTLHF